MRRADGKRRNGDLAQMRKKIGTRIVVMLILMTTMFLASSFASGFAQEQALGGMNRLYNSWVLLERYETRLVKSVDDCKFYANMIVHYKMPAVQESLAQGVPGIIEQTQGYFEEMHAIVSKYNK